MGRDGTTEQACEEIDFIIIRFDISSADAMEVLNLLLECLVNETTNETAFVYSYLSTKENGITAVMMNLPFSVLGLIPWYCDFENSPMGSKPETFEDWFWKPLTTIGKVIVGVIITIGMAVVELFSIMIDFFATILMDILPILQYILWLIIRAVILVFVWIVFVIALLAVIFEFIAIVGIMFFLRIFLNLQISTKINKIEVNGDIELAFSYEISSEYNNFLNFYIPTIETNFESNNITVMFELSFFSIKLDVQKFPADVWEHFRDDGPEQSSGSHLKMSDSNNKTAIYILEIISNVGDGMGQGGASLLGAAFWRYAKKEDRSGLGGFILGVVIAALEFALFCVATFSLNDDATRKHAALLGLGIGYVITGLVTYITFFSLNMVEPNLYVLNAKESHIYHVLRVFDVLLTIFGLEVGFLELFQILPDEDIEWLTRESITSISGGFFGLTIGSIALLTAKSNSRATIVSKGLMSFFVLFGFFLISWALSGAT